MAPVVAARRATFARRLEQHRSVEPGWLIYREEDVGDEPNEKKMVRAAKKQFDAMKLEEAEARGRKGKG